MPEPEVAGRPGQEHAQKHASIAQAPPDRTQIPLGHGFTAKATGGMVDALPLQHALGGAVLGAVDEEPKDRSLQTLLAPPAHRRTAIAKRDHSPGQRHWTSTGPCAGRASRGHVLRDQMKTTAPAAVPWSSCPERVRRNRRLGLLALYTLLAGLRSTDEAPRLHRRNERTIACCESGLETAIAPAVVARVRATTVHRRPPRRNHTALARIAELRNQGGLKSAGKPGAKAPQGKPVIAAPRRRRQIGHIPSLTRHHLLRHWRTTQRQRRRR